jgi:membrane fusion protein (multidrug efflux system)
MPDEIRPAVSKFRWVAAIAIVVVVVVAAGAGWFLLKPSAATAPAAAAPATPAPAVGVRPASLRGISQSFEFVGRIKAIEKVEVRARVEGFLDKVLFREGQDVKAGDLLYQIEKTQFLARVEEAKANLAVAEAEQLNARLQYSRQLELSQRQYSPQSQVDQNKAALDQSSARIMQARAALTLAETNLGYTDIRAPIAGRIGRHTYTLGNLVNPASGVLATIVSQNPIYVVFPVSVRDLQAIREARRQEGGSMAKIDIVVRLSNGQEYPQRGTWNFTDPQVDQQTDTLIMRATLPNPNGELVDGEFVTAVIRERREEQRLVVPQAALQVDQSGYYVLVVDGQHKVEQRRVQTGANRDTEIVITSGLAEGDKVIVEGIQKVRPGQVVQETILPPPARRQESGR